MGDGYEHRFLACTPAQHDNLRALARYLVANGEAIDAGSGVLFDPAYMIGLAPTPFDLADAAPAPQLIPLPPLAYGPLCGVEPLRNEGWDDYCERSFGVAPMPPDSLCLWLQSLLWRKTDDSATGAALRIAYALQYGIPHDHIEISMGQAWTDYDRSGFLWDELDPPCGVREKAARAPRRKWPARVGAREIDERRAAAAIDASNYGRR